MKAIQLSSNKVLDAVEGIWKIELEARNARYGYYSLPDNFSEIILVLRGSFQRLVIGTRQKVVMEEGHCYLAPARSKGVILYATTDTTFLVLKLKPNLHNAIYENKTFQSRNEVREIDFAESLGKQWARFPNNDSYLIDMVHKFLEEKYRLARSPDHIVQQCIEMIRERNGEIKVKDLNAIVGVCKSTLEEKFSKELGLSPKEFCKIEKINYFLRNYELADADMTLTQLTFKSGYYDQSHLIKEFRYFVDLSPRKYLKEVNKLDLRTQPQPVMALAG